MEILHFQLGHKFGWSRSTQQQQEDCITQLSSVSAHCFFVCLCFCWVNVKVLSYGFCELCWKHVEVKVKVKQSRYRPVLARRFPGSYGSQISWKRHRIVVRLSALRTSCFYPKEIFLVLISARGCVDPGAIVRSEGFYVNDKFQWHQLGSNQMPSDL